MRKDACWLYASTVLWGSRALAFGVAALASPAHANPVGGTVSAGTATISGQGTPVVQVNQNSDRAVIDWKSFNIAPGESTRFKQPSATSAILNRIHDQNPSQILGNLSANGQVMLVNPNGMLFGKDSRVDVSGLVATSANISSQSFMSGAPFRFGQPGLPDSAVINQGTISVREGGLAALVAPEVRNEGLITGKGRESGAGLGRYDDAGPLWGPTRLGGGVRQAESPAHRPDRPDRGGGRRSDPDDGGCGESDRPGHQHGRLGGCERADGGSREASSCMRAAEMRT